MSRPKTRSAPGPIKRERGSESETQGPRQTVRGSALLKASQRRRRRHASVARLDLHQRIDSMSVRACAARELPSPQPRRAAFGSAALLSGTRGSTAPIGREQSTATGPSFPGAEPADTVCATRAELSASGEPPGTSAPARDPGRGRPPRRPAHIARRFPPHRACNHWCPVAWNAHGHHTGRAQVGG